MAQAVWNGKAYYSRVCNNPNCRMCASIQQQLNRQTYHTRTLTPTQPPTTVSTKTEYRTVYESRTRLVKRCNGKVCWYEQETYQVPITKAVQVPVSMKPGPKTLPSEKVAQEPPKIDTLTNTELISTPEKAVDKMLRLLNMPKNATYFDLGSGDGRFLIKANKLYNANAIGIELDSKRAQQSRERAKQENADVFVFSGDVRNYDLSEAEYVSMYLYPELMEEIVPGLKNGTKIVSFNHKIPGVDNEAHLVNVDGAEHQIYVGYAGGRPAASKTVTFGL